MHRRFQHNQEDCTITVLELLPNLAESIIEALPSEQITQQLQQKKAERLGKSVGTSDVATSELSSGTPSVAGEDGRSFSSFQSESYVHTSQLGTSDSGNAESRPTLTKVQLWNDLKISCQRSESALSLFLMLIQSSNHKIIHSTIHSQLAMSIDPHSTQPTRAKELPLERCISSFTSAARSYNHPGKPRGC